YRARWYDPQAGRFISEDPLGFGGGDINLFTYVKNAPMNHVDALGLSGSDLANWIDGKLDYAERYWHYDGNERLINAVNGGILKGFNNNVRSLTNLLRVG